MFTVQQTLVETAQNHIGVPTCNMNSNAALPGKDPNGPTCFLPNRRYCIRALTVAVRALSIVALTLPAATSWLR